MKVHTKLTKARVELQNMELKKSGKNNHSGYSYYELGDMLPAINALCEKHGLTTIFQTTKESAGLIVVDNESNENIDFSVPYATAQLPKGQDIQNLGASITYLRRYLLMIAFEIVESDIVEQVQRDIKESIEKDDLERIQSVTDKVELTQLFTELKSKYKESLLVPHFKKRKEILAQDSE